VNSENVVEKRNIRPGQVVDGMRVIEEGLRSDDLVVVNGIQRARPGGKVDPEKTSMASLKLSKRQAAAEVEQVKSPASDRAAPESKQMQQ